MAIETRPGRALGTILVVDDLEAVLRLMSDILSAEGYRVVRAHDGEEALDVVAREQPDLVISDVRMPRADGFTLCRSLKSSAATRLIPVVLMTGASEANDRMQAIEAGAQD